MRGGKEHARQPQSIGPDEGPRASGSAQIPSITVPPSRTNVAASEPYVSESSNTQPTGPDVQSTGLPAGTPSESNSGSYQDVLVDCNSLVEEY